jgi:Zn-finger nucleic acid-binding protein
MVNISRHPKATKEGMRMIASDLNDALAPFAESPTEPLTEEKERARKYVDQKGVRCMFCECQQLEGGDVEIDEGCVTQAILCVNCDATWVDAYKLDHIQPMTGPSKDFITNSEKYPLMDWQHEVHNGDTKLGYDEWVKHRKEAEESSQPTES